MAGQQPRRPEAELVEADHKREVSDCRQDKGGDRRHGCRHLAVCGFGVDCGYKRRLLFCREPFRAPHICMKDPRYGEAEHDGGRGLQ